MKLKVMIRKEVKQLDDAKINIKYMMNMQVRIKCIGKEKTCSNLLNKMV